jgi:hypothetical protein
VIEATAVYLIVAIAAVWTVWRPIRRGWAKRRAAAKSSSDCAPDCACHVG